MAIHHNPGKCAVGIKTIRLRISPDSLEMINRAAKLLGRNRSDFLVESACHAASEAMAERQTFQLDDQAYEDLVAALKVPAAPNE